MLTRTEREGDGAVLLPRRTRRYRSQDGDALLYRSDGSLHPELCLIHEGLLRRLAPASAHLYCRTFLEFESFLMSKELIWNAPPLALRQEARRYLLARGAHVSERNEQWVVRPDLNAREAPPGPQTLRLQFEALRSVYREAQRLDLYPYAEDPFSRRV